MATNKTLGAQLYQSSQFSGLLNQLTETLVSAGKNLDGVKPADPELKGSYQQMLDEVAALRGRPLFYPYIGSGVGRGPYVELQDGSVKLDLINGIGVHILGHGHPAILKGAIEGAASDLVMQGNLQPNREYLQMQRILSDLGSRNSRLKNVWLATCGTIANENALKLCRQKRNGARMIVAFNNAFAGRSTMMAEITDNPAYKVGQPTYNEVLRLPFFGHREPHKDKALNILKEHFAKHGNDIGCFTFEPMQGEGGYKYPSKDFLLPLLDFCREHKIPVWADEVQTFCRTGNFFAFETFGIGDYIDVCTIAKTAQAGATLFTKDMSPDAGLLGGTFSGSSSALAGGIGALTELDNGQYMGPQGKIQKIGKAFVDMLNDLANTTCKGLIHDADGLGLMVAFTPKDGTKATQGALLKKLFEKGMMSFGCGHDPYRIRFLIPAVMTDKDIQLSRRILEEALQELA